MDEQAKSVELSAVFSILLRSGSHELDDVYMQCDRHHIYLGNGGYLLFKFAIDDRNLKSVDFPVLNGRRSHILNLLHKTLEETLAEKCLCYVTPFEGHILGLIIYPRLKPDATDLSVILSHVKHSCETAAAAFTKQVNVPLYAAISSISFDIEEISTVYSRLSSILQFQMYVDRHEVIAEEDHLALEKYDIEEIFRCREIANLLTNAIAHNDVDSISEILSGGKLLLKQCFPSLEYLRYRMQNVLSFLVVEIDERGIRTPNCGNHELYCQLLKAPDYHSFCQCLLDGLTSCADTKLELTAQRIQDVKEYVLEHIDDISMTVSSIAEAFQVSQPYLSAQFHKYSGQNLSDYIHLVRTEQAGILIETTDMPISQLIGKVGYTNLTTFYRAYKKYQGITPGQLRKW